jgi:hypothetical protein
VISGGASAGAATKSRLGFLSQTRVPNQLACEPQKRLLKVVVGLGRDVVVLQVLLAVECDCLCKLSHYLDSVSFYLPSVSFTSTQ